MDESTELAALVRWYPANYLKLDLHVFAKVGTQLVSYVEQILLRKRRAFSNQHLEPVALR